MRDASVTTVEGKRVVVLGLGRFGGGVGVARWLSESGAAGVVVVDEAEPATLEESVGRLAGLHNVECVVGEGASDAGVLEGVDLLVVNPAVKPGHALVAAAESRGVAVTTEINLLVERLERKRVIGVTGTAGKSTTAAMIAHVLQEAERVVWLGGNIGGSLLGEVGAIAAADDGWVVLELSSFMLDRLEPMRWSPGVAVVTTYAPNHLDWHGDEAAYREAKQTILEHQRLDAQDVCVLGATAAEAMRPMAAAAMVDPRKLDLSGLVLPGEHNRENAKLAVTAAAAAGVDVSDACEALRSFRGLAHRLELVADVGGVRWFNDSKATTPEAAELAVRGFDAGTVHLICGGADKGANLMALGALAAARCRAVYTIGQTGDRIAVAAEMAAGMGDPPREVAVVRCGELERAVLEARSRVSMGDVVVLSPGCASWDQFANYEERGARFVGLCPVGEGGRGKPRR